MPKLLACAAALAASSTTAASAGSNGGLSLLPSTTRKQVQSSDFDVLVYDATSGGVTAAVAAARSGLVQRVGVLCASWPACFDEGGRIIGGMTANGLGQSDIGGYDVFGGIAREFYHRNWLHYFPNGSASASSGSMQDCRLPDANKCNVTANIEPHVGEYLLGCFAAVLPVFSNC
eukprot:INCI12724.2.p1 GENE.INCI12724.2~~INCI12724.2.p1  ORF type:complete len:175 (-),score=41.43 INCI12724.2:790-1314(-)